MVKSKYNYFSWKDFIKYLKKFWDLEIISQKWSHIKISFNSEITIIPNHKELAYGTFTKIMKQINLDEDLFLYKINS